MGLGGKGQRTSSKQILSLSEEHVVLWARVCAADSVSLGVNWLTAASHMPASSPPTSIAPILRKPDIIALTTCQFVD